MTILITDFNGMHHVSVPEWAEVSRGSGPGGYDSLLYREHEFCSYEEGRTDKQGFYVGPWGVMDDDDGHVVTYKTLDEARAAIDKKIDGEKTINGNPLNLVMSIASMRNILEKNFFTGYNIDITGTQAFGQGVLVFFHCLSKTGGTSWARVAYFVQDKNGLHLDWAMMAGEV